MGNTYINIRFGKRHLKLTYDWEWSFDINPHWMYHEPPKWFEVYCIFGKYL